MTLQSLGAESLVHILSYLDVKDRASCAQAWLPFQAIIENPENDSALRHKKMLKECTFEQLTSPHLQRIMRRHCFGTASSMPTALSDSFTERVERLFSYKGLLIGTTRTGEAKIWDTRQSDTPCTFTLSHLLPDFRLPVAFSNEGNWLIRTAVVWIIQRRLFPYGLMCGS